MSGRKKLERYSRPAKFPPCSGFADAVYGLAPMDLSKYAFIYISYRRCPGFVIGVTNGRAKDEETVMTNRTMTWLAVGLVSAALGGIFSGPLSIRPAYAEEHNPRIHHALQALRDARAELNEAHHDFHGKKQDALDAIQHAIDRLDEIKDYDN
jgi:hypothetical protein